MLGVLFYGYHSLQDLPQSHKSKDIENHESYKLSYWVFGYFAFISFDRICQFVKIQNTTGKWSFQTLSSKQELAHISVSDYLKSILFQEILDAVKSMIKPNDIIPLFEVTPTSEGIQRLRLYKREVRKTSLWACWQELKTARNIKRSLIWLLCWISVITFCYCCCFVL